MNTVATRSSEQAEQAQRDDVAISERRWLILAAVLTATFMAILDAFVVNVAIPSIQTGFDATIGDAELVIAGYTLAYAVLLITGGRLGDIYGRKTLFLIGMVLFTLASAFCGLAPTVQMLIGARVLQGIGAALMYPQVLAVIQLTFSGPERNTALAIFAGTIGLASVAGQLMGGLLIAANLWGLTWRPVFLINVPVGLAAIVAASAVLPPFRSESKVRLDLPGVALVSIALLLLAIPLLDGREAGWPWWMLAALIASIPAGALFVLYERRKAAAGGSPLVNMALFGQRAFSVGITIALIFFGGITGLFFVMAVFLQAGLHFSPLAAGLTFVPLGIGFTVSSLSAPRVLTVFGRGTLGLGYIVVAIGLAIAFVTVRHAGADLDGWDLAPALFVMGIGQGLGMSPLVGTVLGGIRSEDAGAASGVLSTAIQVGTALGVAIVGMVFFAILGLGENASPISSEVGAYVTAFAWTLPFLTVLALLALGLVFALPAPQTEVSDAILERIPSLAAGLAYAIYFLTGGRVGDELLTDMLAQTTRRRTARIAEAPLDPSEFLAYHYSRAAEDRVWLNYLAREALAIGDGQVAHEDERRQMIQRQIDEVRQRQGLGLVSAEFDPAHVRLMAFALATYPRIFAQITRMVTGHAPESPEFEAEWTAFLRDLGRRLHPRHDDPTAPSPRHTHGSRADE
jgi:EmrB/QacA subfamily drug resistance transporter